MGPHLDDDVAIVGIGCRFPGSSNDPEKYWDLLSAGRSAWSEVPKTRFNWESFHHPNPGENGVPATNHQGGHFVDVDISRFDANFFGISPAEAEVLDPQHRLQLETAYEALENAGIPLNTIKGSRTGVYMGILFRDWDRMLWKDPSDISTYHVTGAGEALLSNRISYTFDLKGPSFTVDTGCSGSVVALHQACQSLKSGETDLALVGGSNMILSPDQMIPMSYLGQVQFGPAQFVLLLTVHSFCNPNGKSFSFDERGAGYGRGEGAATIVVKRLSDAIADGDSIRAVIKGTAVNQDGRTVGITTPSQAAQEELARTILASTRVNPDSIDLVEAHGTGTKVGDVAEVEAVANVFCNGRRNRPLFIGSCKGNVGHLEAASGVAGVIKSVLALEKGQIPPQANFEVAKEELRLEERDVKVPRTVTPWPHSGKRRAFVNSFGYGGTNCMIILERSPVRSRGRSAAYNHVSTGPEQTTSDDDSSVPSDGASTPPSSYSDTPNEETTSISVSQRIFPLSAKSSTSLQQQKARLRQWLEDHRRGPRQLDNLAFTLGHRRTKLPYRQSFIAGNTDQLISAIDNSASDNILPGSKSRIVYLFTGQGAQWYAMGRELLTIDGPFASSIRRSDRLLRSFGSSWSLVDELSRSKSESKIDDAELGQPACTAIQIAIVDAFKQWHIAPAAVLGHSSGEIAAAYAAGALSHETALRISYHRGFLSKICKQRLPDAEGAMLAAGLDDDAAQEVVAALKSGRAVVACANSPSSTTLSGDKAAIDEAYAILQERGVFARRLRVDTAYHSHFMEAVAAHYQDAMKDVKERHISKGIRFVSSVTASDKTETFGPSYWVQNLVSKVRFVDALQNLVSKEAASSNEQLAFIEIGPHSVLGGALRDTLKELTPPIAVKWQYASSLIRDKDARTTVLQVVSRLLDSGSDIAVQKVNFSDDFQLPLRVISDLGPYPWDHSSSHWREPRLSREYRFRKHAHHELLGVRDFTSTVSEPSWRSFVSIQSLPWLQDHVVQGATVFPGAGYISMAIEAVRQTIDDAQAVAKIELKNVTFLEALLLPNEDRVELHTNLRAQGVDPTSWYDFTVSSFGASGQSIKHSTGSIKFKLRSATTDAERDESSLSLNATQERLQVAKTNSKQTLEGKKLYANLRKNGNHYGKSFALAKEVQLGQHHAVTTIHQSNHKTDARNVLPYFLHPTQLDVVFQTAMPLYAKTLTQNSCLVLASIAGIEIQIPTENLVDQEFTALTEKRSSAIDDGLYDIAAFRENDGALTSAVNVSRISFFPAAPPPEDATTSSSSIDKVYELKWDTDVDYVPPEKFEALVKCDHAPTDYALYKEKRLSEATAIYIDACLKKLEETGATVSQPHYEHLVEWMKGYITSEQGQDTLKAGVASAASEEQPDLNTLGVLGEGLKRNGEYFYDILTGKLDPLAHLLQDGLLFRIYNEDSFRKCNEYLRSYIAPLIFKNPNMHVLEIGAGTGSSTIPLFNELSPNGERIFNRYDFTDISPGFFENGREKLAKWREMVSFRVLDLDVDAKKQGFQEGDYDLVIAANVVHATRSINDTLRSVRKMLKPTGKLLLIEIVDSVPMLNVMFGVLSGWWTGVPEGRTTTPLLSVPSWDKHLSQSGFGGVQAATNDFHALMMANAIPDPIAYPTVQVLNFDTSDDSNKLVEDLKSSFEKENALVQLQNQLSSPVSEDSVYVLLDPQEDSALSREESFNQVRDIVTNATRLVWISFSANQSQASSDNAGSVTGFARVARSENNRLSLITIDVQSSLYSHSAGIVSFAQRVVSGLLLSETTGSRIFDMDYTYKDGSVQISRLLAKAAVNNLENKDDEAKYELATFQDTTRPLRLDVEHSNPLKDATFTVDENVSRTLASDEIIVDARAHALGADNKSEFAGIVAAVGDGLSTKFSVGDRVLAAIPAILSSRVKVKGNLVSKIPQEISFSTAASLPVPYVTAYYSLVHVGRLDAGQRVLIHNATSSVGQAAVLIAQHLGAEVFATADGEQKAAFLKNLGVSSERIFTSTTFKSGIHRLTGGQGVDLAFDPPNDNVRQDTLDSLSDLSTLVEIAKPKSARASRSDLSAANKAISFATVDLRLLLAQRPKVFQDVFSKALDLVLTRAIITVEPTQLPIDSIEEAFKLAKDKNQITRIVVENDASSQVKLSKSTTLSQKGTAVVAGGLGGFGKELGKFLARNGIPDIVVLTRQRLDAAKEATLQAEIGQDKARVHIVTCDITDRFQVEATLKDISGRLPLITTVIQAAMLLKVSAIQNLSFEDYTTIARPKILGTSNLIQALSDLNISPSTFLALSSVQSIVGGEGQANYSAGNGYVDHLAQNALGDKTRYISLNLGMIDDTVYTEDEASNQKLKRQGAAIVNPEDVLKLIKYALSDSAKAKHEKQLVFGLDTKTLPPWLLTLNAGNALFNHLLSTTGSSSSAAADSTEADLQALASKWDDVPAAKALIVKILAAKIASLVSLNAAEINARSQILELGLDSLVTIQLRNWLRVTFEVFFETKDVLVAGAVGALAEKVIDGRKERK